MKYPIQHIGLAALLMLSGCFGFLFSQQEMVLWSSFNMGYAEAASGKSQLSSAVGEPPGQQGTSGDLQLAGGILAALSGQQEVLFITQVQNDTPSVGQAPNILLSIPQGLRGNSGRLYYRITGQQNYTEGNLVKIQNNLALQIPASDVTERGLDYYVSLPGGKAPVTFPADNPEEQPAHLRVAVAQRSSPQEIQGSIYKMISIPFDPAGARIFDILTDDYGEYDNRLWRLFRYENGGYTEFPDMNNTVIPGEAYWLITRDSVSFDVENSLSTEASSPYEMILQPEWNQIGNPFAFPVSWETVTRDSLIEPPVFFDGLENIPNQEIILPWEGYWIKNNAATPRSIYIQPVETASSSLGKSNAPIALNSGDGYVLKISASVPDKSLRDSYNYLGFVEGATDEKDVLDFSEPPVVGEYLQLALKENQDILAGNFKPLTGEGQQWEIQARSSAATADVHISIEEMGDLPQGFQRYIFDQELRAPVAVNSRNEFQFQIDKTHPVRSFKLVIGTEAFAKANSGGLPLTPVAYSLSQNYPNPFNPETEIEYSIQQLSEVRLEIFNILGERVHTIFNGKQDAGVYRAVWDGRTSKGFKAASGVYIYRLTANKYSASKKMILVR